MHMTNSQKIKEKVKERYAKVELTGDSCCGPSVSFESGGGRHQDTTKRAVHNECSILPNTYLRITGRV
jgi:hypothetical protein